jgi:transposase
MIGACWTTFSGCSDPVPWRNRRWKPRFSKRLYRERNLIERFFSKLKHFRRVPCL